MNRCRTRTIKALRRGQPIPPLEPLQPILPLSEDLSVHDSTTTPSSSTTVIGPTRRLKTKQNRTKTRLPKPKSQLELTLAHKKYRKTRNDALQKERRNKEPQSNQISPITNWSQHTSSTTRNFSQDRDARLLKAAQLTRPDFTALAQSQARQTSKLKPKPTNSRTVGPQTKKKKKKKHVQTLKKIILDNTPLTDSPSNNNSPTTTADSQSLVRGRIGFTPATPRA